MLRAIIGALLIWFALDSRGQGYYWQPGVKERKIKNLSVDAGAGFRMYFGDIQQKGSVFNPMKFAYGAGLRYQFNPRLGVAGTFAGRGYKGQADHGGFPDAIDQMTGQLWEGNVTIQYSWLAWEDFTRRQFTERDPVTKINLYIGAGFGGSMFSASYTSRKYKTHVVTDSTGRDSTFFTPVDRQGSAAGFGMYVPVVGGFRYRIRPQWYVGFEFQRHIYISKNIDALVSKNRDGMATMMIRVGYTFGQRKKLADYRVKTKKTK
ncbi:MAG: hypothetical protein Kow0075_11800 [Salibacteraceae bacterium]